MLTYKLVTLSSFTFLSVVLTEKRVLEFKIVVEQAGKIVQ